MYDKQKSVLRIETTINNPRAFKACRERGPAMAGLRLDWLPIEEGAGRMGVRRVE